MLRESARSTSKWNNTVELHIQGFLIFRICKVCTYINTGYVLIIHNVFAVNLFALSKHIASYFK